MANDIGVYPKRFELDVVASEKKMFVLCGALLVGVVIPTLLFVVLQLLRMVYIYIVHGEIVWHPFRLHRRDKSKVGYVSVR